MADPYKRKEVIGNATLYLGDALTVLRSLSDESVNCCVTSPPYWGLRDYGTGTWEGGDPACKHEAPPRGGRNPETAGKQLTNAGTLNYQFTGICGICGSVRIDKQLGAEPTPAEYVAGMVAVFQEVRRVLRDDGTLWLNLGDSYASGGKGGGMAGERGEKQRSNEGALLGPKKAPPGLKNKDLVGIPWRVAFALQADGWYLRQDIIWAKPNPMPESVTDRCTKAHEYIFMLSKSARYYYDQDAIKVPATLSTVERLTQPGLENQAGSDRVPGKTNGPMKAVGKVDKQRGHSRKHAGFNDRWDAMEKAEQCSGMVNKRSVWTVATQPFKEAHFATFPPKLIEPCILAGAPVGGVVLDPFNGSGTTGVVSLENGRSYIGIELNPDYLQMTIPRIENAQRQERLFA